ncbi:bacteriocin immunity protein [Companilactobacillus sp.]|jgi:hypothetical protein|uniref:bacteriocin immunity protein n=1 Tax=Companilactobacillus sp. TaxID=2767905 RepID=UPI0025BF21C7|nr:bacteriocin immunity protein [Companilactobacillus sp.]MCH4009633.1 bacteriocin immunity protein [Companilactobacillus sp.]MCH4052691.1 bacteriocin immunity protein [Companilactobacillus sp.]MCH4077575.1 bacteriocin immunity protein [Companilactobacillus sp.]MCH4126151.1 bacteriocin immunity protein [Companilactobacillus sp.]MCI1311859.1 bacteriocin immunity protein [Companilactobacillus sp.]
MKTNQEKVDEMMNQLSTAFSDPEVKKYSELKDLIFKAATELEKNGNVDLVSSRLSKKMTIYYLSHKKEFPRAAVDLFNQISQRRMKYDSTALAAIMLPVVF